MFFFSQSSSKDSTNGCESNSCNFIKLVIVIPPQISVSKVVVLTKLEPFLLSVLRVERKHFAKCPFDLCPKRFE